MTTRPVTDDAARRLCAALAPLQALDADVHALGYGDTVVSSSRNPDGRRVAQVESGILARAAFASRRLAAVPVAARGVLLEVARHAHNDPPPEVLALQVARAARGADALAAFDATADDLKAADAEANDAKKNAAAVLRIAPLSKVALACRAQRDTDIARRETAAARRAKAEAALVAEGLRLLREALTAWDATETEE